MQNIPVTEEPDTSREANVNGQYPQKSDNFRVYHCDGTLIECLETGITCMRCISQIDWTNAVKLELELDQELDVGSIAEQYQIGIYIFQKSGLKLDTIKEYNIKPDMVPLRLLLHNGHYSILFTKKMLSQLPDSIWKTIVVGRCQTLAEWTEHL